MAESRYVRSCLLQILEEYQCADVEFLRDECIKQPRLKGRVSVGDVVRAMTYLMEQIPHVVRTPWGYVWASHAYRGATGATAVKRETDAKCDIAAWVYDNIVRPRLADAEKTTVLDGGTTALAVAWEIARRYKGEDLRQLYVLTHSIHVVACLARSGIPLEIVGGHFRAEHGLAAGSSVQEALRDRRSAKPITIVGVNAVSGKTLSCGDEEVTRIRKQLLDIGDPPVIVATADKLVAPGAPHPLAEFPSLPPNAQLVTSDPSRLKSNDRRLFDAERTTCERYFGERFVIAPILPPSEAFSLRRPKAG
jgi:hypothetical protein